MAHDVWTGQQPTKTTRFATEASYVNSKLGVDRLTRSGKSVHANPKCLRLERRIALALWKGLIGRLLELQGPKHKAQVEKGFLADIEEADNVVRRVLERKMCALGMSADQLF